MNTVTIVATRGFELEELTRSIPSRYRVGEATDGRIVVEANGSRVYIGKNEWAFSEFEEGEMAHVRSVIPDPVFYSMDFSDIEMVKDLLVAVADRGDVLVDNDAGVILSGNEFVQLLRQRADWDWRG